MKLLPAEIHSRGEDGGHHAAWHILMYLLFSGYIALTLWPLLLSGYYSDDLIYSTMRGKVAFHNSSFLEHAYANNEYRMEVLGRFQPAFEFIAYPIAYFADDLRVYKSAILLTVIMNALLLSYMMKCLLKDRYVALIPLLMFPLFLQFRLYHDPVLSFSGFLQLFMSMVMCSIIFYSKYLDSGRRLHLVLSLMSYMTALCFTESCLPLILLFVAMVFEKCRGWSLKQKILTLIPHMTLSVLAVVVTLFVRMTRDTTTAAYDGVTFGFKTAAIAKTLLLQLYSTIPLGYYLSNPFGHFSRHPAQILSNVTAPDCLVLAFFVASYCWIMRNIRNTFKVRILIYLGLPLVLFPALLISLSLKYQTELQLFGPGTGYIQVYIQYFGALLIMLGVLLYLNQRAVGRLRMALHAVVVVLTAITLLLNMQANRAVVEKANIDLHFRREALVLALKGNILGDLPNDVRLVILDEYVYDPYPPAKVPLKEWFVFGYPWKNDALVYQYSGKRMKVYGDLDKLLEEDKNANNPQGDAVGTYVLTIKSFPATAGIKDGFVELSRLTDITTDTANQVHHQSQKLKTWFPHQAR